MEQHHLVEHCHQRCVEVVVPRRGDGLEQLARAAIDAGADVIGMPGGDGSQAVVASVASERGHLRGGDPGVARPTSYSSPRW